MRFRVPHNGPTLARVCRVLFFPWRWGLLGIVLAAGMGSVDSAAADTVADRTGIEQVLANYRTAVVNRDEDLFMSAILDERIAFYAVSESDSLPATLNVSGLADLAQFRKTVFHSERRFKQSFDNVRIDQDGALAQVSLHFITRVVGEKGGGEGWKSLQLLRVDGQWKIASELYTVRAIDE